MLSARPLPMSAVVNLCIYADPAGGSFVSFDIWPKIGPMQSFRPVVLSRFITRFDKFAPRENRENPLDTTEFDEIADIGMHWACRVQTRPRLDVGHHVRQKKRLVRQVPRPSLSSGSLSKGQQC